MQRLLPASLALALVLPCAAQADTASDIITLRQEIDAIRAAYESRLQALEKRLQAAEAQAVAQPPPVALVQPAPMPAPAIAPAAAQAIAPASGANAFNPAISLILSGLYTHTSQDPSTYAITGFPLPVGAGAGPGSRGFSLAESELSFAASIDPWWRGAANFALHGDNSVSVEEAFVQTTALGNGLGLKAGRFFSGVGYLNAQHAHTWDFVDNPLVYQALLGTQYGDDGVQMTWLAPTDHFIELGAEFGRGRSFPGGDNSLNGAGMWALMAHSGGDIGDSQSWRAGLSVLSAKADRQELLGWAANGTTRSAFTGDTRVWVADVVWKWSPNGNATRTSLKLQGEYLHSTRSGELVYGPGGIASAGTVNAVQSGWYLQAIYQFMRGWRVGMRGERLDAGQPDFGNNAGLYASSNFSPRKTSLMLDYSASEFSRIRLQLAQDRARQGSSDSQLFLQYQMSLGAHGAHSY